MRTVTEIRSVYTFEELNENAKQKVKERIFRNGYFWQDEAWESLKALKKLFPGIKITQAEFSPHAFAYYQTGQIDDEILNLSGARLYAWVQNNLHEYLYQRKPQGKYTKNEITGKWAYKRRSRIIYTETDCPFTGYCMDADILEPIRQFLKNPEKNTTLEDIISNCVNAWEKSAAADCEWQESDEYLKEHCEANGYEFTEEGDVY